MTEKLIPAFTEGDIEAIGTSPGPSNPAVRMELRRLYAHIDDLECLQSKDSLIISLKRTAEYVDYLESEIKKLKEYNYGFSETLINLGIKKPSEFIDRYKNLEALKTKADETAKLAAMADEVDDQSQLCAISLLAKEYIAASKEFDGE